MFGLPSLCDNFRPVCMVYFVSVGERREERGAGEGGLCVFMDLGGEGEGQLAGTGRIIRDLMKKQLNLSAGVDPKDLEGGEGGGGKRRRREEARGREGGAGVLSRLQSDTTTRRHEGRGGDFCVFWEKRKMGNRRMNEMSDEGGKMISWEKGRKEG